MRYQQWIFLLGVLLAAAGCTSIPLSTLWKMRSFDAAEFASIQGQDVRVKIVLPAGFKLDMEKDKPSLQFAYTTGTTKGDGTIEMVEVSHRDFTKGSGRGAIGQREYILRIADASLENFRALQTLAKTQPKGTKWNINVGFNFNREPVDGKPPVTSPPAEVRFTVAMRLFPKDGYLVLFDDVKVKMQETGTEKK